MRIPALLAVVLLTFGATSCGDDDPAGPGESQTMVIRAEVTEMFAFSSCEGDGVEGEADLFSKLRITMGEAGSGSDMEVVKETDYKLVQLGRAEGISNPGIEIELEIEPYDGMRVGVSLETYENDPGGRQITEWFAHTWRYMGDIDCWTDKIEGDCIPESSPGAGGFTMPQTDRMPQRTLPENGDPPCSVRYEWTISIQPKGS